MRTVPIYRTAAVRDGSFAYDGPIAVTGHADAAAILRPLFAGLDREHFKVLYLTTKNRPAGVETAAIGSIDTTIARPADIFKGAMARNAAKIIVAHNHPSGDPTPSPEDLALTRKLTDAGKLIGIEVLDHLVFGEGDSYASIAHGFNVTPGVTTLAAALAA